MPRVEQDPKQPGVYYLRESDDEKQARLEKEDLLRRIAALETQAAKGDPTFKPPDPPAGLKRR